ASAASAAGSAPRPPPRLLRTCRTRTAPPRATTRRPAPRSRGAPTSPSAVRRSPFSSIFTPSRADARGPAAPSRPGRSHEPEPTFGPRRIETMRKIIQGVRQFQDTVFRRQRDFFELLARKQQSPQALFITCSDSRINPNLLTSTEPGDLFLLRNAGNIIPPYGAANGGEGATIEYAVSVLKLQNIIVCGHFHCGAMHYLLRLEGIEEMP